MPVKRSEVETEHNIVPLRAAQKNRSFYRISGYQARFQTRSNRILQCSFRWSCCNLNVGSTLSFSIPRPARLKERPRIKASVIGPPETPSVFIFFFNWQVNQ